MTETIERTDGAAIGRSDRRKEDGRLLTYKVTEVAPV